MYTQHIAMGTQAPGNFLIVPQDTRQVQLRKQPERFSH